MTHVVPHNQVIWNENKCNNISECLLPNKHKTYFTEFARFRSIIFLYKTLMILSSGSTSPYFVNIAKKITANNTVIDPIHNGKTLILLCVKSNSNKTEKGICMERTTTPSTDDVNKQPQSLNVSDRTVPNSPFRNIMINWRSLGSRNDSICKRSNTKNSGHIKIRFHSPTNPEIERSFLLGENLNCQVNERELTQK